ncbi:MAG: glycosyltransferase [Gaiellaceae bacterium]
MRLFFPSATALLTDRSGHGEGLIAWRLLSGLAARGHEIVACVRQVDVAAPIPFEVVETGRRLPLESLEPFAYSRYVERVFRSRGGADAFDVAHWLFPPDQDEIAFAPARELPFFYGPHSLRWLSPGRPKRAGDAVRALVRPVLRHRYRAALRDAAAVFVSVPEATDELPREVAGRVRVLPFGVDPARFRHAELPQTPTVLFVGSVEARKGVFVLLEAFARVQTGVDADLVIAGDGADLGAARRRASELGIDQAVSFLGAVAHEGIPDLYAQASLLCLPAAREPYGMVVLEAMASGRAVVAVDAGGPRYLVGGERGGRLVPPESAAALAGALEQLLTDRDSLEAIGRHNRRRVERQFTWDRVIDELEQAYRDASPYCACGASRYALVLAGSFERLGLHHYPFSIVRCRQCGLARTLPVPDDTQYARGYSPTTRDGEFTARLDTWSAARAAWVRRQTAGGRLLDVGCNVGDLVAAASDLGFDAEGIDVDPIAIAAGRKLGRDLSQKGIDEVELGAYDAIVLSHVAEHVIDLPSLFGALGRALAPGGRAFLFVPHYRGLIPRLMGRRWLFWAPHEHVWHFTPETLIGAVERSESLRAVDYATRGRLEPPSRGLKGLLKRLLALAGAAVGAGDELVAVFEKAPTR